MASRARVDASIVGHSTDPNVNNWVSRRAARRCPIRRVRGRIRQLAGVPRPPDRVPIPIDHARESTTCGWRAAQQSPPADRLPARKMQPLPQLPRTSCRRSTTDPQPPPPYGAHTSWSGHTRCVATCLSNAGTIPPTRVIDRRPSAVRAVRERSCVWLALFADGWLRAGRTLES